MPASVFRSLRKPSRLRPYRPAHLQLRPCPPRLVRRSVAAALLAVLAVPFSVGAEPGHRARPDPADPTAAVPSATYSSLARYRRHAEQPVRSWREANETVNRIGGWRAYAREAASPEAPQSTARSPTPAPLARPTAPAASARGGAPLPAPAASQPATHGGSKH